MDTILNLITTNPEVALGLGLLGGVFAPIVFAKLKAMAAKTKTPLDDIAVAQVEEAVTKKVRKAKSKKTTTQE